jgi:prolipoprotein diacylglyceryltransferase
VAVHPTQLYSSGYGLLLFIALLYLNRRWYRVGLATGVFLALEAVFRFVIEPLRYYESEMVFHVGELRVTFNQIVALVMFILGIGFVMRSRFSPGHKSKAPSSAQGDSSKSA